jgi:hypothetical protein
MAEIGGWVRFPLERYSGTLFFDFVGFFFPDVHAGIDWEKEYTFMDKELQQLVRDSEIGRRLADKLVRVHTRDGAPLMVLTHIEVQGAYQLCAIHRGRVDENAAYNSSKPTSTNGPLPRSHTSVASSISSM